MTPILKTIAKTREAANLAFQCIAAGRRARLTLDRFYNYSPASSPFSSKFQNYSDLGLELLFHNSKEISAIPGSQSPFVHGSGADHASKKAVESLISRLKLGDATAIKSVDYLSVSRIAGSVVLLGGPINNLFARSLFGTGHGSPLLELARPGSRSSLPIEFDVSELSYQKLAGSGLAKQHWPILIDGVPQASDSDALLLTSIPNIYAHDRVRHRIVNIAGRHTNGMIALDSLLRSPATMEELWRRTRNIEAWQALFEVNFDESGYPVIKGSAQVVEITHRFEELRKILRGKPFFSTPYFEKLSGFGGLVRAEEIDIQSYLGYSAVGDVNPDAEFTKGEFSSGSSGEASAQLKAASMKHSESSQDEMGWWDTVPSAVLKRYPLLARLVAERREPDTDEEWAVVKEAQKLAVYDLWAAE